MQPSGREAWQRDIGSLLASTRIGFLATTGAHGTEASMAPYALYGGDILLHLSQLARHTANLVRQPVAGFMICSPEASMDSPLALPRLSLQGRIESLSEDRLTEAGTAYLRSIPEAEPLFGFTDFALYTLHPEKIHWVGGFGSARDIPAAAWQHIAANEGNRDPRERH